MQRKPRGEGKIIIDKGMYDGFLYYMKKIRNEEKGDKYKVNRSLYGKILKGVNEEIARRMIEDAKSFRMPAGLATIRVKKYRRKVRFRADGTINPRSLAPNWPATMELWEKNDVARKQKKLVYFINDHTDGYSACMMMEKYSSDLGNVLPYCFKPTRKNDRHIAEILLDPYNKTDYYL